MKISIVTDTSPAISINGVSTTLKNTVLCLTELGHNVQVIDPTQFKTTGSPGYPEVRLSLNPWKMSKLINDFKPDAIHISTEGPLGLFAILYCRYKKIEYTTSYHTKFPEYLNQYFKLPVGIGYTFLRWFHNKSSAVLVTTETMKNELTARKFKNMVVWNRGVDRKIFKPHYRISTNPKPILLCVSRISSEKNLEAFLNISMDAEMIMVGDGPDRAMLEKKYPHVKFLGYKHGEELAKLYAQADVFVFPSLTDTFGIVMIEALSTGTPVASYPVTGPIDIIEQDVNGYMSDNLEEAVGHAYYLSRKQVYESSLKWTWEAATKIFLDNLAVNAKTN
jgi:glycosyltransferase involved in cell wall biosynthesis